MKRGPTKILAFVCALVILAGVQARAAFFLGGFTLTSDGSMMPVAIAVIMEGRNNENT